MSKEIAFDDNSRVIFFSDCHRGANDYADDFAPNRDIYTYALDHYYRNSFTYIEIGDSDELWENYRFSKLLDAHRDVYLLIKKFHSKNRFYMIWGNHDVVKERTHFVKKHLYGYYNSEHKYEPLFDKIRTHEGIVLKYKDTSYKIFVVHGHQGDLLNDTLWPLARFLVRYFWKNIQYLRQRNPISPARNIQLMKTIERKIIEWIKSNNQMLIAGHTHHYSFASPGDSPYFNSGCCIYKGYITGSEIVIDGGVTAGQSIWEEES